MFVEVLNVLYCNVPQLLWSCRWDIQNPTNMHVVATTEEFRERVRLAKGEKSLLVVDYFAPWCHACKSLHPKLQKLARSYPNVTFLSVSLRRNSILCLKCSEMLCSEAEPFPMLCAL